MKIFMRRVGLLMLSVYATQVIGSARQPVLVRKIESTDRIPVQVTITGIQDDPISKSSFKKDSKLKFDWAKGMNKITAVYQDNPTIHELAVSRDDAPKGSEITVSKGGIKIGLPVSVLTETMSIAVSVPNDSKTYEIISGTEGLSQAIATSSAKKSSPYVVGYTQLSFGNTGVLKIFKHKRTKIYVISSDCSDSTLVDPSTLKQLGSNPTLRVDSFCNAVLQ